MESWVSAPQPCHLGHDRGMGSDGSKPRKSHGHLPKVPKDEEANTIPLAGLGGSTAPGPSGREGHQFAHHEVDERPGKLGSWFLRRLGLKSKRLDPGD